MSRRQVCLSYKCAKRLKKHVILKMPKSFIGAIHKPRKLFVVCLSGTFVFVSIRDRKIKHTFFCKISVESKD